MSSKVKAERACFRTCMSDSPRRPRHFCSAEKPEHTVLLYGLCALRLRTWMCQPESRALSHFQLIAPFILLQPSFTFNLPLLHPNPMTDVLTRRGACGQRPTEEKATRRQRQSPECVPTNQGTPKMTAKQRSQEPGLHRSSSPRAQCRPLQHLPPCIHRNPLTPLGRLS